MDVLYRCIQSSKRNDVSTLLQHYVEMVFCREACVFIENLMGLTEVFSRYDNIYPRRHYFRDKWLLILVVLFPIGSTYNLTLR